MVRYSGSDPGFIQQGFPERHLCPRINDPVLFQLDVINSFLLNRKCGLQDFTVTERTQVNCAYIY